MKNKIDDYIEFHRSNGGTGKIFNFKLIHYDTGLLELEGDFTEICLNPDGSVQGGMMTAMLDDVTSLLIIAETKSLDFGFSHRFDYSSALYLGIKLSKNIKQIP